MGRISKQLKNKRTNAHVAKKSMELAIFAGNYATELGSLLLKKGLITLEEEEMVSKSALHRTQEEMSEMGQETNE